MDRTKAALFSTLGERVPGSKVLDLFAGSGALGIEALSRGAAMATFVESDAACCRSISQNLEKTRLTGGRVVRDDAHRFLGRPGAYASYDLIIADPPYTHSPDDEDHALRLLTSPTMPKLIGTEGILVVEHLRPLPASSHPLEQILTRRYGKSTLSYFRNPIT